MGFRDASQGFREAFRNLKKKKNHKTSKNGIHKMENIYNYSIH